tara:strand:+ start:134 stop:490 length:357 start_codon:yes stop_codon:yes gene_type:complete
MATQHPRSSQNKHVIRADGTIRVITQGALSVGDDETVVLLDKALNPGLWFYDFKRKKLVKYTNAQLHKASNDGNKVRAANKLAREAKVREVKAAIADTSPETRKALELLSAMLGLDIT